MVTLPRRYRSLCRKHILVVGIKVTTEIKTNEVKHTNNSFFTMVAKDDSGTPVSVPELELFTHHEMRNFVTAIRRSVRKEAQVKLQRDYDAFIPKEDFALLTNIAVRLPRRKMNK